MTEERRDPPTGEPRRFGAPGAYPGDREVPERLQPSPGVIPRGDGPGGRGLGWPAEAPGGQRPGDPSARSGAGGSPSATTATAARPGSPVTSLRRGPRRARLTLKRVDPWSVLKVTFVFSLAMLIVGVVAVIALYVILGGMGVFDSISSFLQDVSPGSDSVRDYAPLSRVAGGAAVIGAVNVVLMTALATLGAFIYNLCADLVGGVEVTLTERD